MKNIKQLIIATTLLTSLGPVTDIYGGPTCSRLACVKEQREKAQAAQLQAANMALLMAAESEDLDFAIEALRAKANVNMADQNESTPLLLASRKGNTKIIEILINAKAEVNLADKQGRTPLLLASQNGHINSTEALLEGKAEVEKAREDGATPLLMASQNGHIAIVNRLLEAKAEVEKTDQDGATSLFVSSQNGHTEIAKILIQAKAEVDKASQNGTSPLLIASKNGHTKIVVMLIAHNANPNLASNRGNTALSVATSKTLETIAQARETRPQREKKEEELLRCAQLDVTNVSVMLALAVTAERPGHQCMAPWLLKSNSQAHEQAGNCCICTDSFTDLVEKMAELRRTHKACWHLVCDICEQRQRSICDVAPLTQCPMGCHKSRKSAFKPTEAQAAEFAELKRLFENRACVQGKLQPEVASAAAEPLEAAQEAKVR